MSDVDIFYSGSLYIIYSIYFKYSKNFELKIARRDRVIRLKVIALTTCCFILFFSWEMLKQKILKWPPFFKRPLKNLGVGQYIKYV